MRRNRYKRPPANWRAVLTPGRRVVRGVGVCAAIVFLSLALVFVHDFLTQSEYFRLSRLTVNGAEHLTVAQISAWSRLDAAPNVLGINRRLLRQQLLAHPWIAFARVQRNGLNGLTLTLEEHIALAVVELDEALLLNSKGHLFKTYSMDDPQDLPLVRGLTILDFPNHARAGSTGFKALMKLLEILQTQTAPVHANHLAVIDLDPDLGLTMTLKPAATTPEALRIILGYRNYHAKLQRLERVLTYARARGLTLHWLDLQHPGRMVARPLTSAPPDIPQRKS